MSTNTPTGEAALPPMTGSPLKVLRLTLKRKWFDMISIGEKREEYREPKDWIFSRLIGKDYDVVEFSNGYGKHVPKVTVSFWGWHQGTGDPKRGAIPGRNYVVIRLGDVISSENVQSPDADATE